MGKNPTRFLAPADRWENMAAATPPLLDCNLSQLGGREKGKKAEGCEVALVSGWAWKSVAKYGDSQKGWLDNIIHFSVWDASQRKPRVLAKKDISLLSKVFHKLPTLTIATHNKLPLFNVHLNTPYSASGSVIIYVYSVHLPVYRRRRTNICARDWLSNSIHNKYICRILIIAANGRNNKGREPDGRQPPIW